VIINPNKNDYVEVTCTKPLGHIVDVQLAIIALDSLGEFGFVLPYTIKSKVEESSSALAGRADKNVPSSSRQTKAVKLSPVSVAL
jgi:hypothetical protein